MNPVSHITNYYNSSANRSCFSFENAKFRSSTDNRELAVNEPHVGLFENSTNRMVDTETRTQCEHYDVTTDREGGAGSTIAVIDNIVCYLVLGPTSVADSRDWNGMYILIFCLRYLRVISTVVLG